jgi:hypothetical protein
MELNDVPMVEEKVSWYMFDGFVMNRINTFLLSEDLIR